MERIEILYETKYFMSRDRLGGDEEDSEGD
jgi:hypothetical protein